MKIKNLFIISLFFGLFLGSEYPIFTQKFGAKHIKRKKVFVAKKKITYPQICGNVVRLLGNHMPDPDQPAKKGAAFSGEILIYSLTKQADTEGDGVTLFTKINTKFIKKISSDNKGHFCTNLPSGKYSIFINDPGYGLYANNFDGEMNICPIEVIKGKNADIEIQVNYSASF